MTFYNKIKNIKDSYFSSENNWFSIRFRCIKLDGDATSSKKLDNS